MNSKRYRYQIQFACFECRKSFKRPYTVAEQERAAWLSHRISGRQPSRPFAMPVYQCPDCGHPATLMGRAFRAPRQNEVEQWRKVELLVQAGFIFRSSVVGRYPDTVTEARAFVESHRKVSDGEKLSRAIRKKTV